MNHLSRSPILRFLLLLLCLSLCGCVSTASRPDWHYTGGSTAADVPVGAEPQPTPRKKRVALTFDDGPQYANEGANTCAIVDELDKYGAHATFFVVGNRIGNGDALAYAVAHGNEIGIHGFTHNKENYFDRCSEEVYQNEVRKTADAIRRAVPDYQVRLLRPPGGHITDARLADSPYSVIYWSVDSLDWEYTYSKSDTDEECRQKVDRIVDNVMRDVEDGSVILLHDIYQSTYDATVILLARLYEAGYEVVSVSELFEGSLRPGCAYREYSTSNEK